MLSFLETVIKGNFVLVEHEIENISVWAETLTIHVSDVKLLV